MFQAPYPIEQLRGASLAYVGSNVLSSMVVYSPSFGLQELLHGLFIECLASLYITLWIIISEIRRDALQCIDYLR